MTQKILAGLILDDGNMLTLAELSHACFMHAEWITELVDEGILEPLGRDVEQWRFSGACLQRARRVRRLQQDLGINIAGAALVLDLLEEIEELRGHLGIRASG